MGRMCEKHEQFVQDGAECPYCELPLTGIDPHTYENAPTKSPIETMKGFENYVPFAKRFPNTAAASAVPAKPKEYTAGGWYSGFDILSMEGNPAFTPFDAADWVTPEVRQQNGLVLPAAPIKIDPSLRADLAEEMDRQDLRRDLFKKFEEFIDVVFAKLRRND